ncbi:MAG: 3'(2'),5'-bisphosphate nucleotidase CysQ [Rickettsiales bacterium]
MKIDLHEIVSCVEEACADLLNIKKEIFCVSIKQDGTECTSADIHVSNKISHFLRFKFPDNPVVSEENTVSLDLTLLQKKNFWMLDPLDGTKAFIENKKHYSINLAFIENGVPKIGIIAFPESGLVYFTDGESVFKKNKMRVSKINKTNTNLSIVNVVISQRSDPIFISNILKNIKVNKVQKISGAEKFCLMAEGVYDVFPRNKDTCEWDVAAGHAIVRALGGGVVNESFQELQYLKKGFRNSFLLTVRDRRYLELFRRS